MKRPAVTPEMFTVICQRLSEKPISLRTLCAAPEMPSPAAVRRYAQGSQETRQQWAEALVSQSHAMLDASLEIIDELRYGEKVTMTDPDGKTKKTIRRKWGKDDTNQVAARRVALENLDKLRKNLNPAFYGDKADQKTAVAIQIVSSLPLKEGEPTPDTAIDGTFTVVASLPVAGTPHGLQTDTPDGQEFKPDD